MAKIGIALVMLLGSCFTTSEDHFVEISSQGDLKSEGEFTLTEVDLNESITFSALVVMKTEGHFLVHVMASKDFGPRDQLICFNPINRYQFGLEKNEEEDGWGLASVETEISDPVGIYIGRKGLYRNYWVPSSVGTDDFPSLVATEGATTSYQLDDVKNTLTAVIDLSRVQKHTLNSVTMVFNRTEKNAGSSGSTLRMSNKTLVFRNNDSLAYRYEYSRDSPIPSRVNYFRNGEKTGYCMIAFREISRSDDVFSLSHYGFTEPPSLKQRSSLLADWFGFPTLIVVFGVLMCAIGVFLSWRQK